MKRRLTALLIGMISVAAPLTARASGATAVAGIPASQVRVHGPRSEYTSGPLKVVGHTDLGTHGIALGNNGGIALIGTCAFIGRWHDYGIKDKQYPIQIVNIAHPSHPRVIGAVPGTTIHDAVAREIRAVDLPGFKLLTVQTFGKYLDESAKTPGQDALYYFGFHHNDCTKPYKIGEIDLNPIRPHEFFQWLDPNPAHNVNGHPRIIDLVTAPLSGVDGAFVDASDPTAPKLRSVWHGVSSGPSTTESNLASQSPAGYGRYTHSISLSSNGTLAFMSQWDGGFLTLDSSSIADPSAQPHLAPSGAQSVPYAYAPGNTHSAVPLRGSPNDSVMVIGDEIYVSTDGCPFGWMRILERGSTTSAPAEIGSFKLAENDPSNCSGHETADRNSLGRTIDGTFSMHNQTVTDRYALASWYGAGLRIVDLKDPAHPHEIAFFVPKPVNEIASKPDTTAPVYGATSDPTDDWWVAMWSYPIIRNGLIYVSDIRNGLYILKSTPGSDLAKNLSRISFLEGNSNLGDVISN